MKFYLSAYLRFIFPSVRSSPETISNERLIKKLMIDIMSTENLDTLTSKMVRHMSKRKEETGLSKIKADLFCLLMQVHDTVKERVGFDVKPYKKYIENEILVTLAQMDKPSKIFDNLYLVSECSAFKKVICFNLLLQ